MVAWRQARGARRRSPDALPEGFLHGAREKSHCRHRDRAGAATPSSGFRTTRRGRRVPSFQTWRWITRITEGKVTANRPTRPFHAEPPRVSDRPDEGGGRSALLTKLLPFAGLVALAVRLFGTNRSAETRLAAGKRPEGTRQGHGKDTARSRQGGRPKGSIRELLVPAHKEGRSRLQRASNSRTDPVGRSPPGTSPGFFSNRPRIVLESSSTPSRRRTG